MNREQSGQANMHQAGKHQWVVKESFADRSSAGERGLKSKSSANYV